LLFGVLPLRAGISWEAHLFGFLAGIAAARWMFPGGRKLFALN
jgi:membrane associated rhomboid family serine protease